MVSPGSLFNSPKSVRTSPGKKRVFHKGRNLKSLHSALTRVSAALAETRNLHNRMMEAGVQKRAIHKRYQNLGAKLSNLRHAMRWTPSPSIQRQLNKVQKEYNTVLPNVNNKERKSAKLIAEYEKAQKRYYQLARRVAYLNGTRTLNNSPLTENEKQIVRLTGAMVKNMSVTRRTARRLPFGTNIGEVITRSAVRR